MRVVTDSHQLASFNVLNRFPPNHATIGADHLREVFYRMGFDDKDIVALSGAVSAHLAYLFCLVLNVCFIICT